MSLISAVCASFKPVGIYFSADAFEGALELCFDLGSVIWISTLSLKSTSMLSSNVTVPVSVAHL